ncbi:MAG TPA: hypothetical protein VEY67_12990 [Candidatus Dormibacteraeota bacterium]|nr:hypothetical protein [Candidatus Dormibacteraeota bacterium]
MTSQIETPVAADGGKATRLRVRVVDHAKPDTPAVDVTLPMGLVRFGLKMARTFSPELKDVDLDWDAVAAALDGGERGRIVHVDDQAKHRTVDVFVE